MKKWILFIAVVLALSGVGMAQTTKPGAKTTTTKAKATAEQKARATVEKINAACNLKAEQVAKLEVAYLEYYKKHEVLKKQKDILSKDVYEQREDDMKKAKNSVLKSTLTAGQYKQWSAAKAKEKNAQKKDSDEE
ncbi:MAG TPA: hypothetical protein VK174_00995, partial [Chitinophagales bacterium]|nr:hypothetical protein [Chitinophagales bacterium]